MNRHLNWRSSHRFRDHRGVCRAFGERMACKLRRNAGQCMASHPHLLHLADSVHLFSRASGQPNPFAVMLAIAVLLLATPRPLLTMATPFLPARAANLTPFLAAFLLFVTIELGCGFPSICTHRLILLVLPPSASPRCARTAIRIVSVSHPFGCPALFVSVAHISPTPPTFK